MECPNCGHEVIEGSEYCVSCGYPLTEEALERTVVVPQSEPEPLETMVTPMEHVPTMAAGPIMAPVAGRTPAEHEAALKSKRRKNLFGALLAILVIAALGFAAWWTYQLELWGGPAIPQVIGMSEDSAVGILEDLGLRTHIQTELADAGIGTVLNVDPQVGTRVGDNSLVTLTIAEARVIPAVDGLLFEQAKQLLEEMGARDITVSYAVSNREEGSVIGIEPQEGETFTSTTPITVTIAQAYTVPNVVGKKLDEAIKEIEAAGLGYRILRVSSTKESNTVVSTAPSAGTKMMQGAIVELSVASPNPDSPAYLSEYFSMTPEEISTYLSAENAVLEEGCTYSYEEEVYDIFARYRLIMGDKLIFTSQLAYDEVPYGGERSDNPLGETNTIHGVRYEFDATSPVQGQYDLAGVSELLKACNIEGEVKGYVTEEFFKFVEDYTQPTQDMWQQEQEQQQEQTWQQEQEELPNAEEVFNTIENFDLEEFLQEIGERPRPFRNAAYQQGSSQFHMAVNYPDNAGELVIEIPLELAQTLATKPFICAYGTQGDSYTWVALISEQKTLVAFAPNNAFDSYTGFEGADIATMYAIAYFLGDL